MKPIKIEVTGENDITIIRKYLGYFKEILKLGQNRQLDVLSVVIDTVNSFEGQFKDLEGLRKVMASQGYVKDMSNKQDAHSPMSYNSFVQTLYELRKAGILDTYNIPKPFQILGPVFNMAKHQEVIITIRRNVTE